MKKLFVFVMLILTLSTEAKSLQQPDSQAVYDSPADIPASLRHLLNNASREEYVGGVLRTFLQSTKNKTTLESEDVVLLKEQIENGQRRYQVSNLIRYDRDFDGRIKHNEIIETIMEQQPLPNDKHIQRQVESVMILDSDKDGILTLKEMSALKNQRNRGDSRGDTAAALLALDPNKDHKLTIDELKSLAIKAFNTMDIDHNGILSEDELQNIRKINQRESYLSRNILPDCKPPTPEKDAKIVFIGAYEGASVSTISVAGQVAETTVIPLNIDETASDKLYVITSSFSPVIWHLKGQVNKISHLVLAGRSMPEGTDNNDMGGDKINIGATNIDKRKVSFFHARGCGLHNAFDEKPENQDNTKAVIEKLLGRTPDIFNVTYNLNGVTVSKATASFTKYAKHSPIQPYPAPEGFDPNIWNQQMRFMPGGIIDLKNEKIVSDAPAVSYLVLPKLAGLAKLVQEGSVIREKGSYKIVKNIPYYPSGLYGAYSQSFLIAKGVTPPKGNPGHSCVISEETGQPLIPSPICDLKRANQY